MPALGTIVRTVVYGIGGRSEVVSGPVVELQRGAVVVATECHGRIVVPLDRAEVVE